MFAFLERKPKFHIFTRTEKKLKLPDSSKVDSSEIAKLYYVDISI